MVLRDKRRFGRDCKPIAPFIHVQIIDCVVVAEFVEAEREAQLAAMDVGFLIRFNISRTLKAHFLASEWFVSSYSFVSRS